MPGEANLNLGAAPLKARHKERYFRGVEFAYLSHSSLADFITKILSEVFLLVGIQGRNEG